MKKKTSTIKNDKIKNYEDLLAWSTHAGVLDRAQTDSLLTKSRQNKDAVYSAFARALRLRDALYHIFLDIIHHDVPPPKMLNVLNEELREAHSHQRIVTGHNGFRLEWIDPETDLSRMLWPITLSAQTLLTDGNLALLKECCGLNCGWLFEDTSKNKSRQWCTMKVCGNRTKVRRFRQRLHKHSK